MNLYGKCIVTFFVCAFVLPVQAFAACVGCGTVPEPDTVWLMVLGGAMAGIVSYFVKRNKK
jgi:hypothetical protein